MTLTIINTDFLTWIQSEKRANKIKQRHITYMSMLLNTAIIGIFKQLSTYVNRVQYTVVKAILF